MFPGWPDPICGSGSSSWSRGWSWSWSSKLFRANSLICQRSRSHSHGELVSSFYFFSSYSLFNFKKFYGNGRFALSSSQALSSTLRRQKFPFHFTFIFNKTAQKTSPRWFCSNFILFIVFSSLFLMPYPNLFVTCFDFDWKFRNYLRINSQDYWVTKCVEQIYMNNRWWLLDIISSVKLLKWEGGERCWMEVSFFFLRVIIVAISKMEIKQSLQVEPLRITFYLRSELILYRIHSFSVRKLICHDW